MKRLILVLSIAIIAFAPIYSQTSEEQTDENTENYYQVLSPNVRGDQFIKIGIMPEFPLNFNGNLHIGGAAQLGYYRFLNNWLALGGEFMVGYNPTIGSNVFTYIPITFGVMFQPYAGRFEFPTTLSTGFSFATCQNKKYFPGFVLKAETSAFYRIAAGWSVGLGSEFFYLPQWHTTTENAKSDYGLFITALVAARYHF